MVACFLVDQVEDEDEALQEHQAELAGRRPSGVSGVGSSSSRRSDPL